MGPDVYARCGRSRKECAGAYKSWGDRATAPPLFLNIDNDVSLTQIVAEARILMAQFLIFFPIGLRLDFGPRRVRFRSSQLLLRKTCSLYSALFF